MDESGSDTAETAEQTTSTDNDSSNRTRALVNDKKETRKTLIIQDMYSQIKDQRESLQKKLQSTNAENETLRQRTEALQAQILALQQRSSERDKTKEILEAKCESLEQERDDLEEKFKRLSHEFESRITKERHLITVNELDLSQTSSGSELDLDQSEMQSQRWSADATAQNMERTKKQSLKDKEQRLNQLQSTTPSESESELDQSEIQSERSSGDAMVQSIKRMETQHLNDTLFLNDRIQQLQQDKEQSSSLIKKLRSLNVTLKWKALKLQQQSAENYNELDSTFKTNDVFQRESGESEFKLREQVAVQREEDDIEFRKEPLQREARECTAKSKKIQRERSELGDTFVGLDQDHGTPPLERNELSMESLATSGSMLDKQARSSLRISMFNPISCPVDLQSQPITNLDETKLLKKKCRALQMELERFSDALKQSTKRIEKQHLNDTMFLNDKIQQLQQDKEKLRSLNVTLKWKALKLEQQSAVSYGKIADQGHKKWKFADILMIKFGLKMTERKVRQFWKEMDTDDSGIVEFEEFTTFVERMGIDRFCDVSKEFDDADKSSNGALDFGEFRACLMGSSAVVLSKRELMVKFKELDKDNSGQLDFEEFKTACELLGFAKEENKYVYFRDVDYSGDGVVSFNEFAAAIIGPLRSMSLSAIREKR